MKGKFHGYTKTTYLQKMSWTIPGQYV